MARLPLVLIHGYSDRGASFEPWRRALVDRGYDVSSIHVGNYRSLTNEVTIKDVAEGVDRALRIRAGLAADEPFDAIVHSTGMLVVRAWLTAYARRRDRLKHLIGLAPATFGSPLAHKGRSWLGALFKGYSERLCNLFAARSLGTRCVRTVSEGQANGAENSVGGALAALQLRFPEWSRAHAQWALSAAGFLLACYSLFLQRRDKTPEDRDSTALRRCTDRGQSQPVR